MRSNDGDSRRRTEGVETRSDARTARVKVQALRQRARVLEREGDSARARECEREAAEWERLAGGWNDRPRGTW